MGRRFTASGAESVTFGSAGLAGFNFTFGTWAAWINLATYSGSFGVIVATNLGTGATFTLEDIPGTLFDLWDGTSDRTATGPATGVPALIGTTKATGTVTARWHMWVPSTNTMTHAAFNGTNVNGATTTSVTYGNDDAAHGFPTGPFDGDVFEMAFWNTLVMSDQEFERLARWKDWARFAPDWWHRESDGREVGDISRTMGRYRSRQTARAGTTRGAATPPPGFGSSVKRRRS